MIKNYTKFLETLNKKLFVDMPIPDDIVKISNEYKLAGKDIFIVGGAVRDFLQGKTPHDYDLVTNALPNDSKRILKNFNVSDEQGKSFGVIRVYTKDNPIGYEIASYRKDISKGRDTKGDDQKVELGDTVTIHDDIRRRDITINAIFYDINKKEIVDLVGGVSDIKNKIIKSVGDPKERFNEDRLRICRVFRFAARSGSKIDKETSDAIRNDNRLRIIGPKDDVSPERIWEEIKKAWEYPSSFESYLNLLTEFNMWPEIFPGSKINTDINDCHEFITYITNLFKFENTQNLENRLIQLYKIDGDIASKVVFLIELLKLTPETALDLYKKKIRCHCNIRLLVDFLDSNNISSKTFIKFIDYVPSVSAEDLMSRGFKGKSLGDEIKKLEIEKFKSLLNE